MAQALKTPGVYIKEENAFPGSVVEVATAIPAFIGYTETASRNGKSLKNIPTRINSFAEYVELFGRGFSPKFKVVDGSATSNTPSTEQNKPDENVIREAIKTKIKETFGGSIIEGEPNPDNKPEILSKAIDNVWKFILGKNVTDQTPDEEINVLIIEALEQEFDVNIFTTEEIKNKETKEKIKSEIKNLFNNSIIEGEDNPDSKKVISNNTVNTVLEMVLSKVKDGTSEADAISEAIEEKFDGKSSDVGGDLKPAESDSGSKFTIGNKAFSIEIENKQKLLFFKSIKLFFSNGGGTCFIVSVGTYEDLKKNEIKQDELLGGLEKLLKEQEPTLVVIPEAVLLGANCYEVYKQVLMHCGKMQNRFAIFDLHDGDMENDETQNSNVSRFREGIGSDNLSYGAVYYPWLDTNVIQKDEVTFKNLDDLVDLSEILPETIAKTFVKENKEKSSAENDPAKKKNLEDNYHLGLIATSPTYSALLDEIRYMMNKMPAAPAMAGKYTAVDNSRGVWKAPANVSLNSVVKPMVNITHDDQENLNVDAVSGKSINAIRTFPGVGTLVWGGRTLNGNSLDWQYINVRRTIIMLEQSIKLALRSYVFEPNDANTWITVKSMIVNFLTEKWKQGALAGSSPEDAFDVQIGLGATMTGLDILQGKMLVSVKLAIVRPAEFIVVTFQQQMQKS
jgi:phage tail sheath protein FI